MGRFISADTFAATGQGFVGNNMFAYCLNNPVFFIDRGGKNTDTLVWWTSAMWWLCGADTALPVGDIIYGAGIIVLGIYALTVADEVTMPQISLEEEKEEAKPKIPDVTYPGDDPLKAPEGYEWEGPDEQGGKRGGYKNKDPNVRDSWHPDLDHPGDIEPHWDYNDIFKHKWRVFPNRIELVK